MQDKYVNGMEKDAACDLDSAVKALDRLAVIDAVQSDLDPMDRNDQEARNAARAESWPAERIN